MAVMWRCPECETMNTEDKCIICGCSKPKTINNTNRPNTVQEQLKISNSNQESLKNVQNSNQYRNKNQYKIDNQQDSINSTKAPASNRKKKNKKIPIAIVSSITVIFIVCVTLSFMKNYVDIADKHEETLPNLTTVSTTAFKLDVATVTNESTITTAPVREEETTTTVVPESETENVVEDDMVVMPSLMKKDYSTAIKILDTIGLQYKVTYSEKKYVDINENCVYSQKPATGSIVKRDTIVEIGISTYQQTTTNPTNIPVSQTTPPVTATRTKQITKDIEIPINNAKMTNGSWEQSISLDKSDFDCSCITSDTIVKVEYELGAPSSKKNAPVELIFQNYTSNPNIWAKIEPFEYDYDKKSASFDYKSMVSSYGSDDFSTVDRLHIGDCGVYIKVTKLTITNCSINSELFDEKNNSETNKITENSTTSEYARAWNETEINETLYIKTSCYSRIKAVVGADSVKKYEVGTKINVIAATDTGFYKLKDGSFIHSDYVTDQKPETVNKKLTDTETSTETESHTLPKTPEENLNINGDVTVFSSFNSYYINNFPIEGTSWNDYYWSSDNEACVQFVSGMLVTYFEGEATITLTYISDPSIVATAKVRVVS